MGRFNGPLFRLMDEEGVVGGGADDCRLLLPLRPTGMSGGGGGLLDEEEEADRPECWAARPDVGTGRPGRGEAPSKILKN